MNDRTTKALLLAIALGLWAHVAAQWLHPVPLVAQTARGVESAIMGMNIDMNNMATVVKAIDTKLGVIENGKCGNAVICK